MTECARCEREGTFKMRAVWPPGAPALCQDTRDCEQAQIDRKADDVAWEISIEHDALQGVIPLDGDVTQGALL